MDSFERMEVLPQGPLPGGTLSAPQTRRVAQQEEHYHYMVKANGSIPFPPAIGGLQSLVIGLLSYIKLISAVRLEIYCMADRIIAPLDARKQV